MGGGAPSLARHQQPTDATGHRSSLIHAMAEHVVKENYALKAWKGTPQDVSDLFGRAFQLAAETDTTGVEWSLSITVETATGEIKFEDLPEFREYGKSSKLADAEKIRAHVSAREGGVTVMVWLQKKGYGFDAARSRYRGRIT